MTSLVTNLNSSTAQEIVNLVTTADGCVHTADTTQLDFAVGKFVQTRRDCRQLIGNCVLKGTRWRRRCVLGVIAAFLSETWGVSLLWDCYNSKHVQQQRSNRCEPARTRGNISVRQVSNSGILLVIDQLRLTFKVLHCRKHGILSQICSRSLITIGWEIRKKSFSSLKIW